MIKFAGANCNLLRLPKVYQLISCFLFVGLESRFKRRRLPIFDRWQLLLPKRTNWYSSSFEDGRDGL